MSVKVPPAFASAFLFFTLVVCAAASDNVSLEVKSVADAVRMKLSNHQTNESNFAEELKRLDQILISHKDEKSDAIAQALLVKALLHIQVLAQSEKGNALIEQLKRDFPNTTQGKSADRILEHFKAETEAAKIRQSLVGSASFPGFDEKDLEGKPFSLEKYKGKALLIHFWATWHGPSFRDLAAIQRVCQSRQKDGFEVVGVSLDHDEQRLRKFMQARNLLLPQYFDGLGWTNKLAVKFGITSIPANYLLDREGKVIAQDVSGDAIEDVLADVLSD